MNHSPEIGLEQPLGIEIREAKLKNFFIKNSPVLFGVQELADQLFLYLNAESCRVIHAKLLRHSEIFSFCQKSPEIKRLVGQNLLKSFSEEEFLLERVNEGLRFFPPTKLKEKFYGCGGNYLIRDRQGNECAIFKPVDEEPHGCNSPEKFDRWIGIQPGNGAISECAAYFLDKRQTYKIPVVTLVVLSSSVFFSRLPCPDEMIIKIGSIQEWYRKDHRRWDELSSMEQDKVNKDQVHKIALLDMRIRNYDRNGGNILFSEGALIPIDHGAAFCNSLSEKFNWCWMKSSQAHDKLGEEVKRYIREINCFYDASKLRKLLGMSRKSLFCMQVTTIFMKVASSQDWTVFEMGKAVGTNGYTMGENLLYKIHKLNLEKMNLKTSAPVYKIKEYFLGYFATLPNLISYLLSVPIRIYNLARVKENWDAIVDELRGLQLLKTFKNSEFFSDQDLLVIIDHHFFLVHRDLLIRRSKFFATMHHFGNNDKIVTIIHSKAIFSLLLEYFYSEEIRMIPSTLIEWMECSKFYGVDDLEKKCKECLNSIIPSFDPCDLVSVYQWAEAQQEVELKYLALNHLKTKFKKLKFEEVCLILKLIENSEALEHALGSTILEFFLCHPDSSILSYLNLSKYEDYVEGLNLRNAKICAQKMSMILRCSQLKSLQFIKCSVDIAFLRLSEFTQFLQLLSFKKCSLIGEFEQVLSKNLLVTHLHLAHLKREDVYLFLTLIRSSENLEFLELTDLEEIRDKDMALLEKCQSLTGIKINGCSITDEALKILNIHHPSLTHLDLCRCRHLSEKCLDYIRQFRSLKYLNLTNTFILNSSEVEAIAESLPLKDFIFSVHS